MIVSKHNPQLDREFLNQPESQYLERKSFRDKPTDVANDVIAFANASGGVVVVGIHNGNMDYQPMTQVKENDFLQVCIDYIHPHPRVVIETLEHEDKKILLYHVEINHEHLYERKDSKKVFMRYGDETRELNHYEIDNLKYDKDLRSFEDNYCVSFDPSDFRQTLLDHYKKTLNFVGSDSELLISRNLAKQEQGKLFYTNACVLLFAQDPDKYIPSSYVRYVKYDGNFEKSGREFNAIKDEKIRGPIPVQIEHTKRFMQTIMNEYVFLDMEAGRFLGTKEFPEEAWLEGVVNAVTHRSYNKSGNPTLIKHFNDRLEISNSGPLPSNVTIENIRQTRYSRNPRIARVLYELGYVRELNEGVKRIFSSMQKALLSEPIYEDKNDTVSLILTNTIKQYSQVIPAKMMDRIGLHFNSLHKIEKEIIMIVFQTGKVKANDVELKSKVSRATAVKYLNQLVEKRLLQYVGTSKNDPNRGYTFDTTI